MNVKYNYTMVVVLATKRNTYEGAYHALSLRAQFLRCREDIHAFLDAQLLNEYAKRHEHGTSVRSVATVHD